MNGNAVLAIVRKDLKVVFQNKGVSIPLIVAPVFILVVLLPGAAALAPKLGYLDTPDIVWLDKLIEVMPAGLQAALAGYDVAQMFVVVLLVYGAAALYPLLPLLVVTGIASDSFAGEKERKTLEALLYTPTTDWELLLGKLLSAWLPALGVAWGGFLLYTVMANLAAWPVMGRLFFPTTMWVILAAWVAPAVAGLGLGAMVLISSRARTYQGAYQLGALVILPIILLLAGQVTGVMVFSTWLVALLGLVLWAIDAALLWFGRRSFRRSKLATQM
ncbi:MAG: ABC transporter permease subunit [Anaerolineae bacterium]|nr:MAG: ABC transporter permease subunit [Anaerolineae bacterium]